MLASQHLNKISHVPPTFCRERWKDGNRHWDTGKEIWRKEVAILDSFSGERPLRRQTFTLRPETYAQEGAKHVKTQGKNSRCKSQKLKGAWQVWGTRKDSSVPGTSEKERGGTGKVNRILMRQRRSCCSGGREQFCHEHSWWQRTGFVGDCHAVPYTRIQLPSVR